MSEMLTVVSERVDDIPMLQARMQGMGIAFLLDQELSTQGNWPGFSLRCVLTIWLTHTLSKGDHRLIQSRSGLDAKAAVHAAR